MVEIVGSEHDTAGCDCVLSLCTGTLCHTPAWKTFLEKTGEYTPPYLFAPDECGSLMGLLPLSHTCGGRGNLDACTDLVDEAIEIKRQCPVDKTELRISSTSSDFQWIHDICTCIPGFSTDPEAIWQEMHKGGALREEKIGILRHYRNLVPISGTEKNGRINFIKNGLILVL